MPNTRSNRNGGIQETFRIDCCEAGIVSEARVPAFGRRPVHGY